MIVMCEGCETSFQVEDRLIKSTGSKVRCSKCRHVFVAYSPAAVAAPEEPLVLSDELPAAAAGQARAELADVGSQIDALFANDFALPTDATAEQEPELLDVDDLMTEDSPPASALTAGMPGDDLKLDLDLDLNFDEEPAGKGAVSEASPLAAGDTPALDFNFDFEPAEEAAAGETLPSLDELGIDLESLEGTDVAAIPAVDAPVQPPPAEAQELDLDFGALTGEPAEELKPEAPAVPPAAALQEEAAGLAAEPAAADAPAEAPSASEGELDLTDLEAMLEGDTQGTEPKDEATAEMELDLEAAVASESAKPEDMEELDLTSIAGEPSAAADAAGAEDGLLSGFDLKLEPEEGPEPEPAPAEAAEPRDDELDFSDITSILEEPPPASDTEAEAAAPGIDLFPDDDQVQAAAAAPASQEAVAHDGLLLDIESLLEDEGAREASEAPAPETPAQATEELDLELAVTPASAADLEIEVEPVAAEGEERIAAAPAATAAEPEAKPAVEADQFPEEEAFVDTGSGHATNVIEMESAAAAALAAQAPRHSGMRKFLLAAAGVLALVIAAIVVPRSFDLNIPFLNDLDVPFLGKIFQTQPEDVAGNLKMAPVSENLGAEFIDHPAAGRLCVVRGQVRNNYDHPRSAIRVTAKLYTKDKALAKTATVFAGNVLANEELVAQDMAGITARLKNKAGANNTNVGVAPGKTIPFMAVFDSLPDNLDEYSVEVAGSTK